MSNAADGDVKVLELTLHGRLVGYLAGFSTGRNVLSFAEEFKKDRDRHSHGPGGHSRQRFIDPRKSEGREVRKTQIRKQVLAGGRPDEIFHEGKGRSLQTDKE
ncbi:hypothetical protein [Marinobacter metalliresistant]|uniref:Uncharacterized protein n=1 Tax=Marinobacter metalliresistant TaxID=2961995 RepID=A0ABZ2W108_9GAMM